MTDCARDVLLACDMSVRLTLESAAKVIRNHRGRAERGRYVGVDAADLYLVLTPAPTVTEWENLSDRFTRWWVLSSVLAETPHRREYLVACHEYVRAALLSQTPHHPGTLLTYLEQVDAVA